MDAEEVTNGAGAHIVLYCVEPVAYQLLSAWAAREHHHVALVVTSPGPARNRTTMYRDIVALVPPKQDVLVTTGMRRIAPMIAALAPDLIVSFTFSFRIPPEITAIPRFGALNLHPSPLPRYRGPNPLRMIYAGEPTIGATLHRIAPEFDTGAILSRRERPLPDDLSSESILSAFSEILMDALVEGTRRALAGEPGTPQDESQASYAASFADDEMWIDWNELSATIRRRVAALNIPTVQAKAVIDGQAVAIRRADPAAGSITPGPAGAVIDRLDDAYTVRTGDGALSVIVSDLAEDEGLLLP